MASAAGVIPSTRETILSRIGEITRHLDECVAACRPEDFTLTYKVATRKRKRDVCPEELDEPVTDRAKRSCHCNSADCNVGDKRWGNGNECEVGEAEWLALCRSLQLEEEGQFRYSADVNVAHGLDLDNIRLAYGGQFRSCSRPTHHSFHLGLSTPPSSSSSVLSSSSSSSPSSPDVFVSVVRRVSMDSVFIPRLLKLFVIIQENLGSGRKSTKRDVYYQNVEFWKKQQVVDDTVDICAKILRVPRNDLGIIAASKGQVAGDLSFLDSSSSFYDASNGVLIPDDDVTALTTSRARRMIVIEKQATYQHVLSTGALKKGGELEDSIVVTGCGYPDYNTRKFVRWVSRQMALPVLLLVDCDPHGIHIALVYKFGSSKMKEEEERLAVPEAKWIGILPTDILRNLVPSEMLLPLTDADWRQLSSLSTHPDVHSKAPSWSEQIRLMKAAKKKAEIQSFAKISPDFLVKQYLPLKIRCQSWLD